jgi:fermentation-respiration switch protein FrsA (DUF1100 family)
MDWVAPILKLVGIAFALYGLTLFVCQRWIVFKPSREFIGVPSELRLQSEDILLTTASGVRIHGWYLEPSNSRKLVLFFAGSIGNISHELSTVAFLESLGAAVTIFDYPGFGSSGGRPSERGCYETAEAVWNYAVAMRRRKPQDIILFGRSLGAAVAAWLAARCPCSALICHGGFTSIPDVAASAYLVPAHYFCYIRFNTRDNLRRCKCPVLLLHSEADTVIPFRHGLQLFEAASEPKRLLRLCGNHYGDEWQATPALRQALQALLAGKERIGV